MQYGCENPYSYLRVKYMILCKVYDLNSIGKCFLVTQFDSKHNLFFLACFLCLTVVLKIDTSGLSIGKTREKK